jgi:hypothetical protein
LCLGGVAVDAVGLEAPLLDCGNCRPAQNKISAHEFEILDAAIAAHHCLQHDRSMKFLG